MFSFKLFGTRPAYPEKIRQLMPYINRARLYLMRMQGLVSKGKYGKYQYRDPDFSRLKNNIFLMIGLAHSGSAQLQELFASNSSVHCCNEILSPDSFSNYYGFLDRCAAMGIRVSTSEARLRLFKWYLFEEARKHSEPVIIFGISLENTHLISTAWQEGCCQSEIFNIARHNNLGVIYLYRKNMLERHLSSMQTEVSVNYHGYRVDETISRPKIFLPVKELVEHFKQIGKTHKHILDSFHHYPVFVEIYYEEIFELIEDGKCNRYSYKLIEKLATLMGVSTPFVMTSTSRHVDMGILAEQIENHEEVTQLLDQSSAG
jgi:hypothetical protein